MNQKSAESGIESEFMKAFIRECILQFGIKNQNIIPAPITTQTPATILTQKKSAEIKFNTSNQQMQKPLQKIMQIPRTNKPIQMQRPIQKQFIKPSPIQPSPLSGSQVKIAGMEKIEPLLSDPSIISIECPGPSLPILVNKSGTVQTTSVTLSIEEINKIMEEVSKITKIPVMNGVFKAAFGKYIMNAVVSDFVGTRFIVQKKNPFMG